MLIGYSPSKRRKGEDQGTVCLPLLGSSFSQRTKKIDRTSFIYKFGGTILLYALLENQEIYRRFYDLEKEGIIHNLRVSVPVQWFKPDIIL